MPKPFDNRAAQSSQIGSQGWLFRLIDTIREHLIIWSLFYVSSYAGEFENAWIAVAQEMNHQDVGDLKFYWNDLISAFRTNRKSYNAPSGPYAQCFPRMEFLIEEQNPVPARRGRRPPSIACEEMGSPPDESPGNPEGASTSSSTTTPMNKRRRAVQRTQSHYEPNAKYCAKNSRQKAVSESSPDSSADRAARKIIKTKNMDFQKSCISVMLGTRTPTEISPDLRAAEKQPSSERDPQYEWILDQWKETEKEKKKLADEKQRQLILSETVPEHASSRRKRLSDKEEKVELKQQILQRDALILVLQKEKIISKKAIATRKEGLQSMELANASRLYSDQVVDTGAVHTSIEMDAPRIDPQADEDAQQPVAFPMASAFSTTVDSTYQDVDQQPTGLQLQVPDSDAYMDNQNQAGDFLFNMQGNDWSFGFGPIDTTISADPAPFLVHTNEPTQVGASMSQTGGPISQQSQISPSNTDISDEGDHRGSASVTNADDGFEIGEDIIEFILQWPTRNPISSLQVPEHFNGAGHVSTIDLGPQEQSTSIIHSDIAAGSSPKLTNADYGIPASDHALSNDTARCRSRH